MPTWLSANFTLEEMCKSPTAIRLGIDNTPGEIEIQAMKELCANILQPVRNHFALPITINSGFRCPQLNAVMGGAKSSQHTMGQAADIEIRGVPNHQVWQWIHDNLEYDQLIAEGLRKDDPDAGWVHVSYNNIRNRKQPLSCVVPGKYVQGLQYVD